MPTLYSYYFLQFYSLFASYMLENTCVMRYPCANKDNILRLQIPLTLLISDGTADMIHEIMPVIWSFSHTCNNIRLANFSNFSSSQIEK